MPASFPQTLMGDHPHLVVQMLNSVRLQPESPVIPAAGVLADRRPKYACRWVAHVATPVDLHPGVQTVLYPHVRRQALSDELLPVSFLAELSSHLNLCISSIFLRSSRVADICLQTPLLEWSSVNLLQGVQLKIGTLASMCRREPIIRAIAQFTDPLVHFLLA